MQLVACSHSGETLAHRRVVRSYARLAGATLFLLGGVALSACGPDVKYPSCETDEHCKQDASGNAITEYCVNQKCQECREDTHCQEGYECKSGRCEEKSECPCEAPKICENKKCVDPECVSDEDCAAGKQCESNVCVDAGCTTDQECGAGMVCTEGVCEAAADEVSAACRPVDASSGDVVALGVVRFDFDQADLRADARQTLEQNAECLREAPDVRVVMEGHCDERGTQEYNLALGERRAAAVRSYLQNLGIDSSRLRVVSKGENEPVCSSSSEDCYARNRRVEFKQQR